jgi:predicted alpha/beta hydrolase family esterase
MNARAETTFVIVPGLRDHVDDHWQTRLAERLARLARVLTVPRLGKDVLPVAAWAEALDRTVKAATGPVYLVAHSAGVMITAQWARKAAVRIEGALLATPPDLVTPMPEGYPSLDLLAANGWLPTPRQPLPFPAVVVASTNDPLARFERVKAMAADWQARLVNVGAVGHLNPASGHGEWPVALELLHELGAPVADAAAVG